MQNLNNEITRAAAIEIGSGVIRFCVADISFGQIQPRIEKIHIEKTKDVFFAENAKRNNILDEDIYIKALENLKKYQKIASELDVQKIRVIATDIFRKANNGSDFILRLSSELKWNIQIIDQDQEGELGFLTIAHAVSQEISSINFHQLVAWDSGNSSAQLTIFGENKGFSVYKSPFGRIPIQLAYEAGQKERSVPKNFISEGEAYQLIDHLIENSPAVPEEIASVIRSGTVVRKYSNILITQIFGNHLSLLTKEEIKNLLHIYLEKTNNLEQVLMIVSIYSIMKKLDMPFIKFTKVTAGNVYGIFLDRKQWDNTPLKDF